MVSAIWCWPIRSVLSVIFHILWWNPLKQLWRKPLEATLLLHVIDSSSPEMLEQIEAVEKVLKEIGADVPDPAGLQ